MECRNHPDVSAVDRCAGCAEAFCGNCLIEMQGKQYCGSCKVMAVQGQPVIEEATLPCKEASNALTYAIVGIFCFGFILGPIAIVKALKAKKILETNPQLTGSGKATAALIIGIVVVILCVIGLIARLAAMANGGY